MPAGSTRSCSRRWAGGPGSGRWPMCAGRPGWSRWSPATWSPSATTRPGSGPNASDPRGCPDGRDRPAPGRQRPGRDAGRCVRLRDDRRAGRLRRLRGRQPARRPARLRPRHGRGRLLPGVRQPRAADRPGRGPLVARPARAGLAAAGRAGPDGGLVALRFGVLGTGYWAQEAHATALAAHPGTELVGVWGRDPARTEAFAARFGIRGHLDLDRLLAEVDAVAIAVPPDVQAELAVAAAAAGRHLLLDKPLALSVGAADRVAAAAAEQQVATLVFFTLRFLPEVAAWMDRATATGDWHGGGGAWMDSVFTEPGSPFADSPWRRRKGALWDLGPHMLALALPVFGPVESVTAATMPPERSEEHTSELQSRQYLVCRLLLEKKKQKTPTTLHNTHTTHHPTTPTTH